MCGFAVRRVMKIHAPHVVIYLLVVFLWIECSTDVSLCIPLCIYEINSLWYVRVLFRNLFYFHWTTPFSFCKYYAISVWHLYNPFKNMYLSIFALMIKYHYQKQCTEYLTLVYTGWILIMMGKKWQPVQETLLFYFHYWA